MKVVLLTNNSNRGKALAHLMLRAGIGLQLVVVENADLQPRRQKWVVSLIRALFGPMYRFLRSRLKLSADDRRALQLEERLIAEADRSVNRYIEELGVTGRPTEVPYAEVPKLNSAEALNAVKDAAPDLCVVLGTSILRARMIAIPRIGTINAHTSILPEYRGARSEFWQCYNQDLGHVGVTLHFIDEKVDTGNVLFQKRQEAGGNSDPNQLRLNNTIAILENYVPVIRQVLSGDIRPKEQGPGTTPTYRFRDITEEKRIRLYKRLLRANG